MTEILRRVAIVLAVLLGAAAFSGCCALVAEDPIVIARSDEVTYGCGCGNTASRDTNDDVPDC